MSAMPAPAGIMGKTSSSRPDRDREEPGAVRREQPVERPREVRPLRNALGRDPVGIGDPGEIGVGEADLRVAPAEEEGLPLPDHAETGVVEDQDLDRQAFLHDGPELLEGHLEPAVADHRHDLAFRGAELRPDGGREGETHRAEAAGGDVAAGRANR